MGDTILCKNWSSSATNKKPRSETSPNGAMADTAVIVVAEAMIPQAGFVFLGRLPRCLPDCTAEIGRQTLCGLPALELV